MKKILLSVILLVGVVANLIVANGGKTSASVLNVSSLEKVSEGEESTNYLLGTYIKEIYFFSGNQWYLSWKCCESYYADFNECKVGEEFGDLNLNTGKLTTYINEE